MPARSACNLTTWYVLILNFFRATAHCAAALPPQQLARDSRTACEWQSFVDDHAKLQSAFGAAMAKLATVGQDRSQLVDCSEVIPVPGVSNLAFA